MKTLVWILLTLGLAIWSAVCWFAYQVIGIGGRFAASNADAFGPDADVVEQISNWAIFGTDMGQWVAIGVWGMGVVVTLLLGWLITKLMPKLSSATTAQNNLPKVRD